MFNKTSHVYETYTFEHQVTNANDELINTYIRSSGEDLYYLYQKGNPRKLGYIDINVIKKNNNQSIFINDMENLYKTKEYKGIGKILHEFVFYLAAQLPHCHSLQLTVAYHSHIFHYKCGFRFRNQIDNEKIEAIINNPIPDKEVLRRLPQSMYMPREVLELKMKPYLQPPEGTDFQVS